MEALDELLHCGGAIFDSGAFRPRSEESVPTSVAYSRAPLAVAPCSRFSEHRSGERTSTPSQVADQSGDRIPPAMACCWRRV